MKWINKKEISILIANLLEHYDVALYGFIAPIIATLFFPPHFDTKLKVLISYLFMANSMIAKPIGMCISALLAQKFNPVYILAYSLYGIAFTTVCIGILPTYNVIGIYAPMGLLLLLIIRGVFAEAEHTIARLYIVADKPAQRGLLFSSLYQGSTMLGIILASFCITCVLYTGDPTRYWRVPFYLGSVTAFCGVYLRKMALHLEITDLEKKGSKKLTVPKISLAKNLRALWENRLLLIKVACVVGFSYMTYAIPFIFMNSFIPYISTITFKEMMEINTALLFFDMLALFVIGYLLRNHNIKKIMLFSSFILFAIIIPCFALMIHGSLFMITIIRIIIVLLGVIFACPINVWLHSQLDSKYKYFIIGSASALGNSVIGHNTTAICFALWYCTHNPISPAFYIAIISICTYFAVKYSKDSLNI